MQHVDGLSRNPPVVQSSACLMAMAKVADQGREWGEARGRPADIWEDEAALAWIQGATTEEGVVTARVRARGEHYQRLSWCRQGGGGQACPSRSRIGCRSARHAVGTRQCWSGEKAELQPLPIVSPGYRWSLDIAGELPMTTKGRRYILLMVEHVSKSAEAKPLVHKTAEDVAEAFEEMVITWLGACGEILMDQGTEFKGGVRGVAENDRNHAPLYFTLPSTKRRADREAGANRYHFSKQAALKDVSPYYLLFGKEPVMPVGAPRLLVDVVTTGPAEKWVAVADARAAYLRQLLPAVMENMHVAQLRDIERYKQRQEIAGKG
ncbi:unnamed protein product [Closterium sp. NIES-54]